MNYSGSKTRRVLIVAYDGCQSLDVTGPAAALAKANYSHGGSAYRVDIVASRCGKISTSCGVGLHVERDFASISDDELNTLDTLIVAGGYDINDVVRDATLLAFVARASANARRTVSICTGAFVLAELRLLNARRATTHWESTDQLAEHYPYVNVDENAIYVRDDHIWTSAGITAGIDLTLALIEDDLGRSTALSVAQQLVVYMMRPGGQAQFSTRLISNQSVNSPFGKLTQWVAENPHENLSISVLAERCSMSERNFARRFARALGMTPARFVERTRLEHARRLLEETDDTLKAVCVDCGIQSVDVMYRLFKRHLGVGPTDYRKRFRTSIRNSIAEIDHE
ncbi:MAG: GlxA family transcriptional regulator [Pseudomonadota bacterium]